MPWVLDAIGGRASSSLNFEYVPGQDRTVTLRFPRAIPAPEHMPIRIMQTSRHKDLPDYTFGPTTSQLLVSPRFRDLLRAWDPVEHTFLPVEVARPDGSIWRDWSFLIPNGLIDGGLVVEESDLVEPSSGPFTHEYGTTFVKPRLMWCGSAIAGRHLWADARLKRFVTVSDDFYAELKRQGLKGWQALESRVSAKQP